VKNMRAGTGEEEFADYLLKLGNGELNDENGNIEIPTQVLVEDEDGVIGDNCPKCKHGWDEVDDNAVECDGCKKWYHYPCVGFTNEMKDDEWYCENCQNQRLIYDCRDNGNKNDKLTNGCLSELLKKNGLINATFGEAIRNQDYKSACDRVILTTTNDRALETTYKIMDNIPGEMDINKSVDVADKHEPRGYIEYPPEFLHTINDGGLPPHELRIKANTPVMLLRNLNPKLGLCNGTRLMVKEHKKRLLICEILTGDKKGNIVVIPIITCTSREGAYPFTLYRRQFPVRPCFAITINKSQGQTLDFVGLDLTNEVFAHGQLYVAFSRVRKWACIKVRPPVGKGNRTRNVVWNEALLE